MVVGREYILYENFLSYLRHFQSGFESLVFIEFFFFLYLKENLFLFVFYLLLHVLKVPAVHLLGIALLGVAI